MTAHARISSTDHVLAEVRNQIGHLTLNRPAGLNALTLDMVRSLQQALDAWAVDPQVQAVVLRGEGPKGFCAGGDIRSLYDSFKAGSSLHEEFFVEEYALDLRIHHYPKPTLVLMDGFTLGGGMGLAQGADLRVVTERSRLGCRKPPSVTSRTSAAATSCPACRANWAPTWASAAARSRRPMPCIAAWPTGT